MARSCSARRVPAGLVGVPAPTRSRRRCDRRGQQRDQPAAGARVHVGEQPAARSRRRRPRPPRRAASAWVAVPSASRQAASSAVRRVAGHEDVRLRQHHGAVVGHPGRQRLGEPAAERPQRQRRPPAPAPRARRTSRRRPARTRPGRRAPRAPGRRSRPGPGSTRRPATPPPASASGRSTSSSPPRSASSSSCGEPGGLRHPVGVRRRPTARSARRWRRRRTSPSAGPASCASRAARAAGNVVARGSRVLMAALYGPGK